MLVSILLGRTITIKCPKCGYENKYRVSGDDAEELKSVGIVRVGFVHRGHILLVDLDQNLFIRGAYIVPHGSLPSNVRVFFGDIRVLASALVGIRTEFVIYFKEKNVVDMRACPSCFSQMYEVLSGIIDFARHFGTMCPKNVGIAGRRFDVLRCDGSYMFSPPPTSGSRYRAMWLMAICRMLGGLGPPPTSALRNIVDYVDTNLGREPNPSDKEKLRSFCRP